MDLLLKLESLGAPLDDLGANGRPVGVSAEEEPEEEEVAPGPRLAPPSHEASASRPARVSRKSLLSGFPTCGTCSPRIKPSLSSRGSAA